MAQPSTFISVFILAAAALFSVVMIAVGSYGIALALLWVFAYIRSVLYMEKDGSLGEEGKKAQRAVILLGAAFFPVALGAFLYDWSNGHFDKSGLFAVVILASPFYAALSSRAKLFQTSPREASPGEASAPPAPESFAQDEVGFALPPEALLQVYVRWGMWTALGMLLPYVLGIVSLGIAFISAGVAGVLGLAGYFYVKRNAYRYVYLSPAGIRGPDRNGAGMIYFGWDEQVVLSKASDSVGKGVRLHRAGERESIFVPLAIARSPAFRDMLQKHGPHHALNQAAV